MKGMGASLVKGNMNFFHYLWYVPLIMLQLEIEARQKGGLPPEELTLKKSRVIRCCLIIKRVLLFCFREVLLIKNAEALSRNWGIHGNKRHLIYDTGTENPCRLKKNRHLLFYSFLMAEQKRPGSDFLF